MTEADLPVVLESLLRAVDDRPDDIALRLHVAELLLGSERFSMALAQCSARVGRRSD